MPDEIRDPDLESVRSQWDAPPPRAGFRDRVRNAYSREFARPSGWRRWVAFRVPMPLAAAMVILAVVATWFAASYFSAREAPTGLQQAAAGQPQYRPVAQPKFVVVSQGEHP
jgi:hypothetical protein